MAKYKVCAYCNANLDFGEQCDCQKTKRKEVALLTHTERPQTNYMSIVSISHNPLNVKRLRGRGNGF